MPRTIRLIAVIALSLITNSFARVIEDLDSIGDARTELENATQETLVVFDIDDTLGHTENVTLTPPDPAIRFVPVEPEMIELIRKLQERAVKVIALTSSGSTPEILAWRVSNLQQLPLDLSASFSTQKLDLPRNLPTYDSNPPTFYRGIICTNGSQKGPVLHDFLEAVQYHPKKVVFFDNDYRNCLSVGVEMTKKQIPVQCYWYKAMLKKKLISFVATSQTTME